MIPLKIRGATRTLGKAQDEYRTLFVRDEQSPYGNVMYSVWEPTPKQLEVLNKGGAIKLGIVGEAHPPVMLDVQPAPAVEKI